MADDRITNGILGDIEPTPAAREHLGGPANVDDEDPEANQSATGGSGDPAHAGSRDVEDGGGVGAELGGTRNYRQFSGATGGDLGNRPE